MSPLVPDSDATNDGAINTPGRPASEKRQDRKSRSVVRRAAKKLAPLPQCKRSFLAHFDVCRDAAFWPARALRRLEDVLNTDIADELLASGTPKSLSASYASAPTDAWREDTQGKLDSRRTPCSTVSMAQQRVNSYPFLLLCSICRIADWKRLRPCTL